MADLVVIARATARDSVKAGGAVALPIVCRPGGHSNDMSPF